MTLRISLLGSMVLVVLGSSSATAQPATDRLKDNERQFIVFTIDAMNRQMPSFDDLIDGQNDRSASNLTRVLKNFVTEQRMINDALRVHVEKRAEPDIRKLLELHIEQLQAVEGFGSAVDQAFRKYQRNTAAIQENSANAVYLSGFGAGLGSYAQGDDSEEVYSKVILGMIDEAIKQIPKAEQAQAEEVQKLRTTLGKLTEDFEKKRQEPRQLIKKLLKSFPPTTATINPYDKLMRYQEALRDPKTGWQELEAKAKDCRQLAKAVPAGTAFNLPRNVFYATTLQLAKTAAVRSAGTKGMPTTSADVGSSAKLARSVLQEIFNANRGGKPEFNLNANVPNLVTLNDDALQACIVVMMYSGIKVDGEQQKLSTQFQLHFRNAVLQQSIGRRRYNWSIRENMSARPEVWVDCARVFSHYKQPQEALECLRRAVQLGLPDRQRLTSDIDLVTVRTSGLTKKDFDQLVSDGS